MKHLCQAVVDLLSICLLATVVGLQTGCDSGTSARVATSSASPSAPPSVVAEASGPDATIQRAATASVGKPRLQPGAKTKVLAAAGDRPYDKTFDDIRFPINVGEPFAREMLTPAIENLVGKRIRIRGFILPTAQKRGIKQFVLVRDNQECCFGPGAALYDCIFVEMQKDKSAEFSIRPVAVEGTFSVNEVLGPDGKHWAIYRIDADEVRQ